MGFHVLLTLLIRILRFTNVRFHHVSTFVTLFPKMGRVVSRLWPNAAIARKLKAVLAGQSNVSPPFRGGRVVRRYWTPATCSDPSKKFAASLLLLQSSRPWSGLILLACGWRGLTSVLAVGQLRKCYAFTGDMFILLNFVKETRALCYIC